MNSLYRFVAVSAILLTFSACGSRKPQADAASSTSTTPATSTSTGTLAVTLKNIAGAAGAVAVLAPIEQREFPARKDEKVMNQIGQEFIPHFLVAQVGQPVRFLNGEDILHNVRVTEVATENVPFNVATVPNGSYDYTFERPGFYTVTCDIHVTMRAAILVTTTPYSATADANGTLTLEDVQPGAYTLTIYAEGPPIERKVEIKPGSNQLPIAAH